jgi:hypothetical protein
MACKSLVGAEATSRGGYGGDKQIQAKKRRNKTMKFLVLATPGALPVPPEMGAKLYPAGITWMEERLKNGKVESSYIYADRGGFAIANVNSHEELFDECFSTAVSVLRVGGKSAGGLETQLPIARRIFWEDGSQVTPNLSCTGTTDRNDRATISAVPGCRSSLLSRLAARFLTEGALVDLLDWIIRLYQRRILYRAETKMFNVFALTPK